MPAPATPPTTPVARLRDPGDLLAAVPYLIGFHPRDSLLFIAFGGRSGRRIELTQRVDLPAADDVPQAALHTRWPADREAALRAFLAGTGPMLTDAAAAHALERERGAEDVADEARVVAPVHPELELLDDAGDHADGEVDQEELAEELRQA